MTKLRLKSEEERLRVERLELEAMRRDIHKRRAEQEEWDRKQRERTRQEEEDDLRSQLLAARSRQQAHDLERSKERSIRPRTPEVMEVSDDDTTAARDNLLHLADLYQERLQKVSGAKAQGLSIKGRKKQVERMAKESRAAEEIQRSLIIINKGASEDKKMESCRKAMLEELDRTQTDDEDKGQEPVVKQLSKMIKIMEGRGRRAKAPSLKEKTTREGTITMDSSSSEDSSEDSSSSSSEEETRKGEKKKRTAKKKAQEKKKKQD